MSAIVLSRPAAAARTLADLVHRLGDVPLDRIRMHPLPGTATEADVIEASQADDVTYELVDGVLVGKPMAFFESRIAAVLIRILGNYLVQRRIGTVFAPDAQMRLRRGLVRSPDVAFFSAARFPSGRVPQSPIPDVTPDLAVEVLSVSNTRREIDRKRREFFRSGTRMMWIVDPRARTVQVFTSPRSPQTLTEDDLLDGGDVLPGFSVSIRDVFTEAETA